jgi:hypothetical protein
VLFVKGMHFSSKIAHLLNIMFVIPAPYFSKSLVNSSDV